MGEGNQPGETWSLVTYPPDDYESQRFYLTDFWSARVVEGEVGSFWVGTYNKPESYMSSPSEDHWDDHMNYDPNQPTMIEWDSQRKDAGREAMAWMAHHCGENQ